MRRTLFFILVFSASCDLDTTYFDDYAGLNLISDYDFNVTGDWNLLSNAVPLTFDDDYMRFEQVGVGAGPSGSESYRLEIKNLFPNGDFEVALGGFWSTANTAPAVGIDTPTQGGPPFNTAQVIDSTTLINNQRVISTNTLKIVTADVNGVNSDRVTVNLDNINLPFSAAPLPAGTYELRADYRTYGYLVMHYYRLDGTYFDQQVVFSGFRGDSGPLNDVGLDDIGTLPGSNLFLPFNKTTGSHFLHFGYNPAANPTKVPDTNFQVTMLDNVRLVRTDDDLGSLWLEMTLPDLESASLTLLPGIYEFRVWVMDEAAADITPLTANRFPSRKISLSFTANQGFADYVKTQTFTGPWASWTQLTLRCENVQFSSDGLGTTQPALRLRISPTDMTTGNGIDAGSLLIARPELFFLER